MLQSMGSRRVRHDLTTNNRAGRDFMTGYLGMILYLLVAKEVMASQLAQW